MEKHVSTRRVFLQRGLTLLAAAPTVPAFLDQTVMAMANPLGSSATQQPSGKDGKILVVVQLAGGNDGLSTVIPYADDAYHRARPAIGHDPKTVLKINDYIGLHPNLKGLKGLYDDGRMAGHWTLYHPNGQRESEGTFVDSKREGVWNFYDNTGKKLPSKTFKNGEEVK